MYRNSYFDLEDYFRKTEETFSEIDNSGKGFTYTDENGIRHEYLESDHGGHTEYHGPTYCYYDEFGEA